MSAQPKTFMRSPVMTMATNMSHMVEFADAIPIWAIVSTLLAKSSRHKVQLPVENRLGPGDFDPTSDKIKVMTMTVSKDLEFPLGATRATQRLVLEVRQY